MLEILAVGARGKHSGFSPGAAARHLQHARARKVHQKLFFFTFLSISPPSFFFLVVPAQPEFLKKLSR